eukprot:4576511-Pyramimonas_sp.AAC.1
MRSAYVTTACGISYLINRSRFPRSTFKRIFLKPIMLRGAMCCSELPDPVWIHWAGSNVFPSTPDEYPA